ncbi:sigma-70 family RNA polymerase sigma factor [Futiania mangrovi]|uniref:Sigma-70 family RNA polymerase sigma factor n=1 Tax=Futiania mangrovi TaxID=2959716 RepID=A0A9J6PDV2_9PROT|nr:sigma-70 family RNA polymerase sigma factor [Futiania mangrovii]MCP1336000.1 sigma-70 family RNA polymerase sigma factor [Futiania mangrovii]
MADSIEMDLLRHVSALRRYARALTGSEHDADDLVQECLARALARIGLFRGVTNIRAYLFSMLHNAHVDRMKAARRRGGMVAIDGCAGELAQAPEQPGASELRDVARAMQDLPQEQREVLLLVGLEGMSYKETSQILDVPIGTVMSRLSRGREALRQRLAAPAAPRAALRRVK